MRPSSLPRLGPILLVLLAVSAGASWPHASAGVPEPPAPARQATPDPSSCQSLNPAWAELGLGLDRGRDALSPGRTFSISDGTLAVLVVVAGVDGAGAATSLDFLASIGVDAVVVRTAADAAVHRFEPPEHGGAGLTGPDGAAIEQVAFCYRAEETPAPPLPPEEAPRATVVARATEEAAASAALATATAAVQAAVATADARGTEVARAQATGAALATRDALAAAEQATADARATGEAEAAEATARSLVATTTAQASEVAAAQATISARATEAVAAASTATAEAAGHEAALATTTALAGVAQATAETLGTLRAVEALTATAFAAPTATPTPGFPPPAVLYRADAAAGFEGWTLPPGWAVADVGLVADGTAGGAWAIPPFQVEGVADYAVEIEARVVTSPGCERNFGVGARGTDRGYYAAGVEWRCDPVAVLWAGEDRLAETALDPGEGWHLYRLEVRGDAVRLLVDGALVLEATDERYREGGEVALWSSGVELEVRSFVVTELPPRP